MASTMEHRAVSPQSSMTLSITPSDAKRMVEASRALNERLTRVRQEKEDVPTVAPTFSADSTDSQNSDPTVPKRVVSTSDGSVASEDTGRTEASLRPVIIEAAASCGSPLVEAFVRGLQSQGAPNHEIQTCLLLFVETSKSGKLRTAFRTLHAGMYAGSEGTDAKQEGAAADQESLRYDGTVALFKCFLTAIASSLQFKDAAQESDKMDTSESTSSQEPPNKALKDSDQSSPNSVTQPETAASSSEANPAEEDDDGMPRASPSFDSSMESKDSVGETKSILSDATRSEIDEIASFAADHLVQHVQKTETSGEDGKRSATVSYESFMEWCNAGGFEIVPWLELLDLSKWESSGKPAAVNTLSTIPEETKADVHMESSASPTVAAQLAQGQSDVSPTLNFFAADDNQKPPADASKILISFDFSGAMSSPNGAKQQDAQAFCIDITEENLLTLRNLVQRTGLASRSPSEVCNVLLRHATQRQSDGMLVLRKDEFGQCIRELVPPEAAHEFSQPEMEHFTACFANFYSCFDSSKAAEVDVKELAVAFSLLCAGNKSAKLSIGFELMDDEKSGHLTQQQLKQYIRSYLTMLVGISLLTSKSDDKQLAASDERRMGMVAAVDKGASWTIKHFVKHYVDNKSVNMEAVSFENIADWYTSGGYTVAPWLELLDLSKLLALLSDARERRKRQAVASHQALPSPRRHELPRIPSADVLFTFPLANRRSLVVLREDATYVRSVVEKLGLLSMDSEDVWSSLFSAAKKKPALPPKTSDKPRQRKAGTGKSMDVDQDMFVSCMEGIVEAALNGRKRPLKGTAKTSSAVRATLINFFQSFDLDQIDRVALNQLMGGLSLLCGGKKSTKLAFAFGLYDSTTNGAKSKKKKGPMPSLSGEEIFLFFRSFLIVTFSCCRQSMDLSAEAVGRYISDTAHKTAEDVMRYQWITRKQDRVNFDEFGEWYNEGGFETAPWLELLDLKKWVLVDNLDLIQHHRTPYMAPPSIRASRSQDSDCPPAPPDDQVDASFFADDDHPIMPMDSIDEMDLLLLQQPSEDKEIDGAPANRAFNPLLLSPKNPTPGKRQRSNSLKFHLVTNEKHGGYMLSVSQRRMAHLRHILLDSGLCQVDAEDAAREILNKATPNDRSKSKGKDASHQLMLSKDDFDSAIRSILSRTQGKGSLSADTQRVLSDLLAVLFHSFERPGRPNAREVACGLTILCRGKKSDKLEYAFEMLDEDRRGRMTRRQVTHYLSSFLSALLSIVTATCLDSEGSGEDSLTLLNGDRCDRSMLAPAVEAGSEWATDQAFQGRFKTKSAKDTLTFDDFAEWYTTEGFGSIPWLELLDLRKWVLTS